VPHLDAVQLLQTGQRSKRSGVADWHWKQHGTQDNAIVLESMPCASPRCTHLPESTISGLLFSVKVSEPSAKYWGALKSVDHKRKHREEEHWGAQQNWLPAK